MAGIDLGNAWADNVWEENVWANDVWAGQEDYPQGTFAYAADTVPASWRSPRWWVAFSIALLVLTGCETVTEVRMIDCRAIEFFPPDATAEEADSARYLDCDPPEWDGLVVRFN